MAPSPAHVAESATNGPSAEELDYRLETFLFLVGYTPRHEHGQVKEFLCQTRDPLLKRPEVCP